MNKRDPRVRILINPHAGPGASFDRILKPLIQHFDRPETGLTVQFSRSKEDGQAKARRAVEEGVGRLLIAGGDGMVNSIGQILIGTETALGVLPAGSGNGFARHFNIPLDLSKAAEALASAEVIPIDVGYANGKPFFVTCSLAWDAALVDLFERSPVRGILPYVFAAVYELFEYKPQPFTLLIDGNEEISIQDPLLCTVANLTQYGGGAIIAPTAKADDGLLQLVTLREHDLPWFIPMIGKVFDGTLDQLQQIHSCPFRSLIVRRKKEGPMQLDGELVSAPAEVKFSVRPRALNVLVPQAS